MVKTLLQGTINAQNTNILIGINDKGKLEFRARHEKMIFVEEEIDLESEDVISFNQIPDPHYTPTEK